MLKKKIKKFSEKLSLLDLNITTEQEQTLVPHDSNTIISETSNENTSKSFKVENDFIKVEEVQISEGIDPGLTMDNVPPSPVPSYKPNPKISLPIIPNNSNKNSTEKLIPKC